LILLTEQLRALGRNYLKLARALTRRFDFCFQLSHLMLELGHLMFEFFNPLVPFSRGVG
jgi:hypothetical protein